jgi:hypothetical protein
MQDFKNRTFIGIVEDNNDPKRIGRCRIRVMNVFDEIPREDIPWASPRKDTNGNSAFIPDTGKIVSVIFDEGNPYKPEYTSAEHYNINLEKKLQSLSGQDYVSMRAVLFDHKTQIYSNDSEGLILDHKGNNINIKENTIDVNLKDNHGKVNIGSLNADQQAVLGNHFFDWFDIFVDNLMANDLTPYILGGAGVVPSPRFAKCLFDYSELRSTRFLSNHVSIVDNEEVQPGIIVAALKNMSQQMSQQTERVADGQIGDAWKSTKNENNITTKEEIDFTSQPGNSTDSPTPGLSGSTVAPTENQLIQDTIDAVKKKGYVVYERPFELNIIGVRKQYEGTKYTNSFVDDLQVIYKNDSGEWKKSTFKITTMPGFYSGEERADFKDDKGTPLFLVANQKFTDDVVAKPILNNKQSSKVKAQGGLMILRTSQMINNFELIQYKTDDPNAWYLRNKANIQIAIYIDQSPDDKIVYSLGKETQQWSSEMIIDKAATNTITVDTWSTGNQIFQSSDTFKQFIDMCKRHSEKYGNTFTYTLIEEIDIKPQTLPTPTESLPNTGLTTSNTQGTENTSSNTQNEESTISSPIESDEIAAKFKDYMLRTYPALSKDILYIEDVTPTRTDPKLISAWNYKIKVGETEITLGARFSSLNTGLNNLTEGVKNALNYFGFNSGGDDNGSRGGGADGGW